MHVCSNPLFSLAPLTFKRLVMQDNTCRLWARLGSGLYVTTHTDSAASVRRPWAMTADFGVLCDRADRGLVPRGDVEDREADDRCIL